MCVRVSLSETEVASSSDRLWIVSDFHTEGPHQRQPPASLSTITADAAIDPLGPSGFEGEKVGVGGGGGASGSVSLSSTFHLSVPLFLATPGKNTHTALSLSSR